MTRNLFFIGLIASCWISACATSTTVVDSRPQEDVGADTLSSVTDSDYAEVDYASTRSGISEVLQSVNNPYPEEFARSRGQDRKSVV